ncbi:hypothetical protein HPB48_002816 [Haemaphysalis longicornis]|uniref:Uncharacterized protein n=1 Tax=Haemaphysalis longicornis TaxID=44386 RepID=A0A9J6GK71_HAELO|nr:hypothetical protein HPB48_002816 [Haemaphysalis longicornis]
MTIGTQPPSSGLPGCQLCNARDHVITYCTATISPEEKRKFCRQASAASDVASATILQGSAGQRTAWSPDSVHVGTSRRCATSNALHEGSSLSAEGQIIADSQRSDVHFDQRCRTKASTLRHEASARAASYSFAFWWTLEVSGPPFDVMYPEHSFVPSRASKV